MQDLVTKYLENFKMERRTKRRLGGILLVLALVVTMGVYWQLKLTGAALTNETYCGKEEHQHSDDCYEWVLVCGYDDAEETAADTSEAQTEAETSGHTHTAECYETVTTLVCGLEDTEGVSETGEGHTHDESCYVTEEVLICGQEETAEVTSAADTDSIVSETSHVHTEACYEKVLVCGLEEHMHSIECMSNDTADVETAADWEATLPSDISDDWAEAVAEVAASQLGYTESTANFTLGDDGETRRGYTRYGAWAGNEYGDWDAMFASFCLHYAGISTEDFPESTGAYAWTVMLNEQGLYANASDYTPVMGELVFFDTDEDGKADRVGIVTSVDEEAGQLTVVEGDYAADADTADAVCANQCALSDSRIAGFGLVSAAQEDSAAAEELTWQTLTVTVDDVTVTVSGMLPEGSSVSAEQVPVELEGLDVHVALEISILLEDGTAYEPEEDTLAVAIESPEITSSDSVYYVPEEGSPEKVTTNAITGYAEFDAEHFSTYVIAADGDDDGDTTTASIISATYTDDDGHTATLTISSSSKNSLLTGQYASLSITLGLNGDVDWNGESVRVYLTDTDTDLTVYGSTTDGTEAWAVGETRGYNITGSATKVQVTLCQDASGYYLEIDSEGTMNAGDTVNFNVSVGYPNETSDGGTVTVSGVVGTSTSSTLSYTWGIITDTYGVTKKTSGTPSFVSDADDDKIYLTGLAYTVTSTRSSADSYGKNPVAEFTYTDTLVLPDGLSWREGLIAAIEAGGNVACTYSSSAPTTVTVTIDDETYTLCTISLYNANWNVQGVAVSVVNENIQITWSYTNTNGTVSTESNVINRAYTITYGDQVIVCDTGENGAYSEGSYELTNTVDANYSFRHTADDQTATDDATATATLSEGALKLTKTTTADTFYMGSSYEFTITAENPEAMPYSGLAYIEDTLGDWLYIEPDEMEELLAAYSNLTIMIQKAEIYDTVSKTVTDVNGDVMTITQQEQGTGTTYTGAKNDSGTLISSDSGRSKNESITLYKNQADGLIYMAVGADLYTIGVGGDYTSLSAALDAIGYYVTNATTYTLRWDLGEDYTLNGSTKLEYTYTATVKDTFMRLTGDQFYDLNQSDSEYWTKDNVSVNGTATNTVIAFDEYDEMIQDAVVNGTVYRDFVLTKGYTVSDSSLTTGSIVTYTVNVKHEGTASYDALPLVDQLADGQILLVPVYENSSNSSLDGLDTTTVNGIEYYVLDQAGTYKDVKINSDVTADSIVVNSDGSTLIYCYLVVDGKGTTSIQYTTLVDAEEGDVAGFSLKNQVWLNDHETHRLYAETSVDGSVLSIDKQIVTVKGSTPAEDETVTYSVLSDAGQTVTYRLELKNNSDNELTVTGNNVYDALPVNVSDNPWTENDISIIVDSSDAKVTAGDASAWATGWSVNVDADDNTQCYINWTDSHTITFTGSVYIYVTLTYPAGEGWTNYYYAYRSVTLKNTFHAYALESEVTHSISTATKATLFKGVYATGLATAKDASTCYPSTSDNSLTYYTNDSAGEYGYVQYYVVLYNEGPVNLYLQDMTDTLPDGFSYISSAAPAADIVVYNTAGEKMEVVTGYTVTGTASSGTVTFSLSGGNLSQDASNSMYYLEPGQAIVFTYKVLTGAYLNTSDTETNTISMPFYDYTSGGLTLSDDVSGETVTGDWYDAATDPKNDGDCEIVTEEDDDGNTTYSLTSSVNVYRNQIRPGITKSATTDEASESDTITWKVTVTNDGESTMAGYYIYDVIEDPYTFTGSLTYTMYDSEGNSTTYTIGTLSMSDDLSTLRIYGYSGSSGNSTSTRSLSESAKDVYSYVGSTYNTRYLVKLSAWKNSDGNWVLCVYFPTYTSTSGYSERTSRAFAIPSGGKGVLTVKTVNSSGSYANMILTNDAYIVPDQSFERYHVGDGVEIPADSDDPIVGNDHAVEAEAMVPINYGYATTSSKSVAEIDEDGNVKGEASSSGSLDSLQLTSSDSTIRYTLSVINGNKEMTQLVLVDSLPEPGDTDPLTTAQRYSDFTVSLAGDPDFEVVVKDTDGNVLYTLTEDNYTVVYSDKTSFTADDLNGTDESKWYSTATSSTRSFRVTLVFDEDFTSIPANATVTVAFNAKIDGSATDGVAWNSFSYLYSSETSTESAAHEATATPIPVGIKAPNIPVLEKQVLDADGNKVSLTEAKTYSFLIYQGEALTDVDTSDIQALLKALYDGNYTFTEVSLTVGVGDGTASMTLENLVQYTASVDSEGKYTATAGTTDWTWTNNTKYTIVELPQDADYPFHTWSDSSNTYTTNSCTFTYSNSNVLTLTCSNQEVTYDLPKTGGTGTGLFTLLGLMLCGGAAMLLFFRRRWV